MSLLPAAVANLTVAEYADVYAFSLDLASRGIARKKNAASLLDAPVNERLERGLASAKKRCVLISASLAMVHNERIGSMATLCRHRRSRKPTLAHRCPFDPQSDQLPSQQSPLLPEQPVRCACFSLSSAEAPDLTFAQTLNRSIRFRATSPPNAKAGPSMHQGFVYRARPSQLDREEAIAKSPVVPSTPAAANGRRPRRHESIQVRLRLDSLISA